MADHDSTPIPASSRAAMPYHFWFHSAGHRLMGVLHTPDEAPPRSLGLVLLHGWAGYRIGAHQMFVKLAREAARRGFPCLRFDFRGRGDSEGEATATTLSTMIVDAQAAARELLERTGLPGLAFVGDCSGSEVAIGAGPLVDRCQHLVLWSAPIVAASRAAAGRAKRSHVLRQYAAKLFRKETWAKLFGGRLQLQVIWRTLLRGGKGAGENGAASDKDIDWRGCLRAFPGDILFIYGGSDPTTADALAYYQRMAAEARGHWDWHVVPGANHAFYSLVWEREVIDATLDWLGQRCSPADPRS